LRATVLRLMSHYTELRGGEAQRDEKKGSRHEGSKKPRKGKRLYWQSRAATGRDEGAEGRNVYDSQTRTRGGGEGLVKGVGGQVGKQRPVGVWNLTKSNYRKKKMQAR